MAIKDKAEISNGMEKIISLCKRRGFIFPGSEIYGGLANSWDFGPLGVELKNNIKKLWWKKFVHQRDDIVGLDSSIIAQSKIWEASGHLKEFSDPLIECKKCHQRFRQGEIENSCPSCSNKEFTEDKQFNLMFKTNLGPVEGDTAYLRPETAQGMFVDFKNILNSNRLKIPFGIAQIGKAFRNEITPGNFIFRTREFEMMEIEYFIKEKDWESSFEDWRKEMHDWMKMIGIDAKKIHEIEVPEKERAHYSKRTIDFEYEFPFGQKELYGLAYRGDFDLKNHEKASGKSLKYRDADTGEEFLPHVIEPTWGVERSVLAILDSSYQEEKDRMVLKLNYQLAPYKAAVFPLLANKPQLVDLAKSIYSDLRKEIMVDWDSRGNVGKRYYAQDEIGTPFCITVDFDSLESKDVTIRDRDTTKQERVKIQDLFNVMKQKLEK
ncbi:MAG: glycyl-tRNA synthetase, glycyl-tRNA synthetase [Parcubacteria group bacterium GW2011_GWC1_38_6]|nr:MAG: Glycine-tRNA ligase [Parcubacteria group bacterium GW2011_GWA1_36_12]KKQ76522.1 MAG: glycyl-tRNA synthetase, glycyl-tRNA synthetase [Parcubacteria group bacterium GW2011_GWC1_38_6]